MLLFLSSILLYLSNIMCYWDVYLVCKCDLWGCVSLSVLVLLCVSRTRRTLSAQCVKKKEKEKKEAGLTLTPGAYVLYSSPGTVQLELSGEEVHKGAEPEEQAGRLAYLKLSRIHTCARLCFLKPSVFMRETARRWRHARTREESASGRGGYSFCLCW